MGIRRLQRLVQSVVTGWSPSHESVAVHIKLAGVGIPSHVAHPGREVKWKVIHGFIRRRWIDANEVWNSRAVRPPVRWKARVRGSKSFGSQFRKIGGFA